VDHFAKSSDPLSDQTYSVAPDNDFNLPPLADEQEMDRYQSVPFRILCQFRDHV
jgi:hypothetical protein